MIYIIAIAAFVSTLLGGLFALKLKDKLHLVLGFSAGAVVAVAFFDLIPEALDIGNRFYSTEVMISVVAIGFLSYLLLDRLLFFKAHSHGYHECPNCEHDHIDTHGVSSHKTKSRLGAMSLCIHSFLDGLAIGLAFQVSSSVGIIVAIAVLTHDFSDGINTVGFIMRGNDAADPSVRGKTMPWLIADAVAPVLGVLSTSFIAISENTLGIILGLFAGFFLYMGASDLIPESHHAHPRFMTTFMTLLGAGILYAAITIAG